ncbi:hypothetical protein FA95DRAFT_1606928 [Auriscalpium vulgare]|uniref:Uncharacterized protein n=1 Tax=Auriscalpium vulgare TaxID=40419 RepID=A0ACB8RQR2_9AGAM|nr:hypothetical protein FA95DRAFT_1606928 [Auriscalpium vulgare]
MFLEGHLAKADLYLDSYVFDQVRATVTSIIQNAKWDLASHINLALLSFEPPIAAEVRNLVAFALGSPHDELPRIFSIGVFIDPELSVQKELGQGDARDARRRAARARREAARARREAVQWPHRGRGRNGIEWIVAAARLAARKVDGLLGRCRRDRVRAPRKYLDMLGSAHLRSCCLVHSQAIPWTSTDEAASTMFCVPAVSYADCARKFRSTYHTSTVCAGALKNNPVVKPSSSLLECARRVF